MFDHFAAGNEVSMLLAAETYRSDSTCLSLVTRFFGDGDSSCTFKPRYAHGDSMNRPNKPGPFVVPDSSSRWESNLQNSLRFLANWFADNRFSGLNYRYWFANASVCTIPRHQEGNSVYAVCVIGAKL